MRKSSIGPWIVALGAAVLVLAGCSSTTATTAPPPNQPSVTAATATTAAPKPVTTTSVPPAVTTAAVSPSAAAKTTTAANNSELTSILGKVTGLNSVKYDSVISGSGVPSMTQKIYLKKSRMRVESNVQGINTIILVDTEKKTIYSYMPSQNTATKMDYSQAPTSVTDSIKTIMDNNPIIIGSETIDGKACLVIQYTSKDGTVKEWLWKDNGFPLKLEITGAKGTITVLNQNIDFGDIADNLFDLPAGVKIMDLGGLNLPTNLPTNFPTNFPTNLPTNPPPNFPTK